MMQSLADLPPIVIADLFGMSVAKSVRMPLNRSS